jgi:serine/threonine protein phosphatase 1
MGLTYAIPDLHGRFDLLRDALTKIDQHAAGKAGTVVALGDYVNKGPQSRQVVERMRAGMGEGWRLFPLKGNHDAMMVEALRDAVQMEAWIEKGGDATIASYGGDPSAIPGDDVAWLGGLPLLHVDANRIFVHAGLDPALPLDAQPEHTLLWKRYPKGDRQGFGGRHVVHGHNSFAEGPELYEGRTNLDTLAWRTGRLVTGVFDDARPGGPVDFVVVNGPPAA